MKSFLLSLGPYGDVWALGTLGNSFGNRIYYRIGVTNENPGGVAWIRIGGHLAQISVGGGFSTGMSRDQRL